MKVVAAITVTMLIAQALCAPQNKPVKKIDPLRNPDLSYEELNYIAKVRNGESPKEPKTLTPCARAILGCCVEKVMNTDCSEAHKCGGHFFDDNPCEDKFIIDALNAARIFYEQFNKVTKT